MDSGETQFNNHLKFYYLKTIGSACISSLQPPLPPQQNSNIETRDPRKQLETSDYSTLQGSHSYSVASILRVPVGFWNLRNHIYMQSFRGGRKTEPKGVSLSAKSALFKASRKSQPMLLRCHALQTRLSHLSVQICSGSEDMQPPT